MGTGAKATRRFSIDLRKDGPEYVERNSHVCEITVGIVRLRQNNRRRIDVCATVVCYGTCSSVSEFSLSNRHNSCRDDSSCAGQRRSNDCNRIRIRLDIHHYRSRVDTVIDQTGNEEHI